MAIDPFVPWGVASEGSGGPRLAVKDVVDVEGLPTGAGHPDLLGEPAERDAEAVSRLRAMSVFVGKTHTDELAWSLGGTSQHYGAIENPVAPGRVCGGSSSGSAAAVAGGRADLGLGTDTAGSVRVPGSFCGLYGFPPDPFPGSPGGDRAAGALLRRAGAADRELPLLEWARRRAARPRSRGEVTRTALGARPTSGANCRPGWGGAGAGHPGARAADRPDAARVRRHRRVRDHPGGAGVGVPRRVGAREPARVRARGEGAVRAGRAAHGRGDQLWPRKNVAEARRGCSTCSTGPSWRCRARPGSRPSSGGRRGCGRRRCG